MTDWNNEANVSMARQRQAERVNVKPCARGCGFLITLVKSKRTGKWYPANVLMNGQGTYRVMPVYAAGGAHVHKCDQPDHHGVKGSA
jgi:hypothetical protein